MVARARAASAFGAHRNLTHAYARARDVARAQRGDAHASLATTVGDARGTSRLLDAALGARSDDASDDVRVGVPERAGVVPRWVERCDDAARDVEAIRTSLRGLREAHAKALLPNFDDVAGEDVVAEALTKEVTKLFKRCDVAIRSVSETGEGDGEERVRVNAQRKLAMELNKLSQDFRKQQKDYLAKLKSQQDRGPGAAGLDSYAQFSGAGAGASAGGGGESMLRMEMLNRAETVSIERDREVMKIWSPCKTSGR